MENLIDRFSESDITNGRSELFTFYNEHIFSSIHNAIFGIGLQNIADKLEAMYIVPPLDVPHNSIQELVVVWGFPGIVFFGLLILFLVKESFSKSKKRSLANWISFIVWFVMGMSGQWITSGKDMLFLVFIYFSLCTDFVDNFSNKVIGEELENEDKKSI